MLRKVIPVIGVFVLAAFVHAVPLAWAQDATATHNVSGVVVDDAGAPLAGAYVTGWSAAEGRAETYDKAITAEDGTFTLKLAAGKGYVTASHDRFRSSAHHDLRVEGDVDGLRLVLNRPPPRTAIVEGTITGPGGEPIEGAQVSIGQGCCH
ncbi:MAG TPA: carboxypeptidase-like regulatory domain-containing protein, partial [Candidatus Thermoplasmatota archaeon]|nr:carboxypeptidase-like regulatory domain-containing protein [Candidatus Thermoplasmatota archaeon]